MGNTLMEQCCCVETKITISIDPKIKREHTHENVVYSVKIPDKREQNNDLFDSDFSDLSGMINDPLSQTV